MEVDYPLVKLESCDGKKFSLTRYEAACSNVLRVLLEQSPCATPDSIVLKYVDGLMLSRLVEWCRMHPVDLESCSFDDDKEAILTDSMTSSSSNSHKQLAKHPQFVALTEWQKEFLKLPKEEHLFRLLHVANFLDVSSLFDATCATIAKRWEAKKVEEIRKQYRIHCDYSQEEEQQMRLLTKRLGLDD